MLTARAARVGQRTGETCPACRPVRGNRFAAACRASRTGGNAREVALGGLIGLALPGKPDQGPLNRPPARRPYGKCGTNIVLKGQHGIGTYGTMPSFAATLSDRENADIANYLRSAGGNHAPTNATPKQVASLRRQATANPK